MATTKAKKGTTAPKVKPERKPKEYRCVCCGKPYATQRNNFPVTQSNWFEGNGHYLPFCKSCWQKMYEFYCTKFPDENEAIKRVCMMGDVFFSEDIIAIANKASPTVPKMNAYMSKSNMKQFSGRTYDNYLDTVNRAVIETIDDVKTAGSKVTPAMVKRWGFGFDDSDYPYLDDEYKDWISRYECNTKAQETLFRNIALAQLNLRKAHLTGETKRIKEATDTLQSLMTSANIKPNQTNENALAEANTFGTLIEKWERTEPIPEPAPEWADVDGIGHYFRTWVLGTILEMFKIKNPYQEEYEQEMEKYTAHKPLYTGDENSPDDIHQKIFGAAGSAT